MSRPPLAYSSLSDAVLPQLRKLGQDLKLARKRRKMSRGELAQRMMVNPKTVDRMEDGDPAVGLGIVATALWVFGLQRRLGELVAPESDATALQEDIRRLPRDFRKTSKSVKDFDF
ncbi:MAG: hypothetical protein QOE55_2604 [Acidobacteriaceae bacterium]|jgi:transcriptional regulator with XRE-family HTH domain|nr:hypothetical protein [Acidobacteriaceae bacterium]